MKLEDTVQIEETAIIDATAQSIAVKPVLVVLLSVLLAFGSLVLPASAGAQPPLQMGGGWTDYPDPNEGSGRAGQADNGEIPFVAPAPLDLAGLAAAFSAARAVENADICPAGVCEPGASVMPTAITFPANFMNRTASERALWLVNSEREARGLLPFVDVDPGVETLAQNWADQQAGELSLIHNPIRVQLFNAVCDGCVGNYETGAANTGIAENLFRRVIQQGTSPGLPMPAADQFAVEMAIYLWMYYDLDQEGLYSVSQLWGHRHALLWNNLIDDHGQTGSEGYIGIGYSKVDTPSVEGTVNFLRENEFVVMNMVDSRAAFPVEPANSYPVGADVGVSRSPSGAHSVSAPSVLLTCLDDRSLTITTGSGLVLFDGQEDANTVADLEAALTVQMVPVGATLTFDRPGCNRPSFDVVVTAGADNKLVPPLGVEANAMAKPRVLLAALAVATSGMLVFVRRRVVS